MKKFLALILATLMIMACVPTAFAASATPKEYKVKEYAVPDTEALRFVKDLKIGLNLGNTFDAYDEDLADEMDYETVWVGVKTTPELIAKIKEAGFNTIRLPVSWHNHLVDGNYTISEQWLDRVNEVVDYCIDQGMYVILNIHHDDGKSYLYPTSSKSAQSVNYITAIWTQLAERFKDYDEHLIFESMNEPRLVGSLYEWNLVSVSPSCIEAVKQLNTLNQTFVNVVRASGGNNETRYLLCPGYDASVDGATNSHYKLPTDPINNDHHIIVAVHAYTPNSFAMLSVGFTRWSSNNLVDKQSVTGFMDKLYNKYVSQGIPVLIDEFGAREKGGNSAYRADFAGFYVANARARGMSCLWWDNNIMSGDGERFGLLDRATLQWTYPEIMTALIHNS